MLNRPYSQRIHTVVLSTLCIWCIGGCAQIVDTPEYVRPELPVKTDWSADLAPQRQIDMKWWQGFGDTRLNTYMDKAISDNADLQVFAARIGTAEAGISQAKATLLPVISAGTRTDTTKISGDIDLDSQTKYGTGGDLVWELDVWGKARKGVAAQRAAYAASEADWRAGYLVMAGQVASTYFQIRRIDEQIQSQLEAVERAAEVVDIYQRMQSKGLAARALVTQQQAELNRLNTQLLELERGRSLAVNGLATLLGEVAGEFVVPSTIEDGVPEPVNVPAGLPSELLSRRPDLVAAEYRLLQSVELVGQAKLAQLPSVGLTGIGGSASFG